MIFQMVISILPNINVCLMFKKKEGTLAVLSLDRHVK